MGWLRLVKHRPQIHHRHTLTTTITKTKAFFFSEWYQVTRKAEKERNESIPSVILKRPASVHWSVMSVNNWTWDTHASVFSSLILHKRDEYHLYFNIYRRRRSCKSSKLLLGVPIFMGDLFIPKILSRPQLNTSFVVKYFFIFLEKLVFFQ